MKTTGKMNWRRFNTILVLFIVFGVATMLFSLGSINDNTAKESSTMHRIEHVETAATLALKQATHDHAFIYAVCSRFATDEAISEKQTADLLDVEKQFAEPRLTQREVEYHNARARILANTDATRKAQIKIECKKSYANKS